MSTKSILAQNHTTTQDHFSSGEKAALLALIRQAAAARVLVARLLTRLDGGRR